MWGTHIGAERSHDFTMRLHEWLDGINGRVCPSNAISVKPIYNIPVLRGYALKGSGAWASRFGAHYFRQSAADRLM